MTTSDVIDILNKASLYIQAKTIIDRQFPDLGHTLKNPGGYKYVDDKTVQPILITAQIAIPFTCLSQVSLLKPNSPSGLVPLLNKAYFSVGNRLYIWDYYDDKELMVYQEDSEITAVAFVAPKREVFTSSVRQLLIISTTRHIKIVGVSANDDKFTLIDMEMSTNATGVKIQKIHGTSQGRVFMIGDDCNLWELDYRREESWFNGQCYKRLRNSSSFGFISSYFNHAIIDICSNSDGNVLYQLGQQSTIFITWVQGDSFQHLVSKNDICKQDAQLKDTYIVSIYATLPNESRKYQLVGITSTGHRLYFSIYKNELEQTIPNTLNLLHVRPPPSSLGGSLSLKSLYRHAVYLAVKADTEELIESNPDIGHLGQSIHQHDLVEFTKRIPVSGKVLAIESMPGATDDDYQVNEIASPLTVAARQFVVFTTTGIFVLVKQRPIDMFQKLIMNSQSDTPTLPEELCSFTAHFGVANTSAFAFAIISDIALTATGVINGAKAVLSRLKNNPADQFVNQDGLALFIHRTIRPIWENPIFKHDNSSLNPPCQLKSTLETLRHLSDSIVESVNMTPEVQAMNELVRYLCQALAFFLYLFESDAHAILSTVPSNVHGRLCNITLKDLMTTNDGNALVHTLSSLLVDYEFKKNQNIAFLLDSIEQHCGHFCGIMDITIAKWINEIKGSKSKENLNQIFSTIIKVAARIPPPGLDGINAAFVQYGYPEYAVELTLASINTHPTTTHYNIYANLLLSLPAPLIGTALYVQNKDLHYVVYAKFIERGRGSDLIKSSPAYLEAFLKEENTTEKLNLLAVYYKSNGRFEDAATHLIYLARLPDGLSMDRRVELLNEAYQCTQSVTSPTKQYEMYELGRTIQELLVAART